MPIERKLAAIMFTDIVGFTKIMGDDETTALSILENQQSLINPIVKDHKGTIIKKMGDGLLIEFPSTVEAVECATQMQDSIKSYNKGDRNLEFHIRIGIHLGDVVILGDDILGDGVNIASRIEPLASPDGICITDAVYQSVKSKLKLDAKRIDEVDLKHIDNKYTIYKIPEKDIEEYNEKMTEDSSSIEEEKPKIKINSLETVSKIPQEIFKAIFPHALYSSLIIHLFFNIAYKIGKMIGQENLPFFQDFNIFPSSLTDSGWSLLFTIGGENFIYFLQFILMYIIIYVLIITKKEVKITFADIRNVEKLLDYMATESASNPILRYEKIEQNKNVIRYWPYARSFFRFFDKIEILITSKKTQSLYLRFDGNVVHMRGMWFSVNKLKKQLKLLELF